MNRDEFMELVYETFADEPDNVLANGIIEAADAYAEHEKAQLSQEGTTSDLISRQAAIEKFAMTAPQMSVIRIYEVVEILESMPTVQPVATDTNVGSNSVIPNSSDTISRQAVIDAVHAMPDIKEIEKVIIDHIYIGDQKLTDLIASGRLRLVGFCEECKHCFPPLVSRVDGEVVQVTSERCSICNGYVEKNGWCYKFERRSDE